MNKQQYLAMPTPVVTAANVAIIEAVKAAGFIVKDDHRGSEHSLALAGVCVYQSGNRQEVVGLFSGKFTPYYCLNRLALHKDGSVSLTRDNCAGTVFAATDDPKADIEEMINNINWETVEEYPVLTPGQYFEFAIK